MQIELERTSSVSETVKFEIVNVIHDLPIWVFRTGFGMNNEKRCCHCHLEMNLNIAHGIQITRGSLIEVAHLYRADTLPIHTACFQFIEQGKESYPTAKDHMKVENSVT